MRQKAAKKKTVKSKQKVWDDKLTDYQPADELKQWFFARVHDYSEELHTAKEKSGAFKKEAAHSLKNHSNHFKQAIVNTRHDFDNLIDEISNRCIREWYEGHLEEFVETLKEEKYDEFLDFLLDGAGRVKNRDERGPGL